MRCTIPAISMARYFPFTSTGRSLARASDQAAGRTAIGLGTIATQDADSVSLTGGTITGVSGVGRAYVAVTTKSSSGSLAAADLKKLLLVDGSAAAVTLTLPAASTISAGDEFVFKCVDATNDCTVAPDGTDKIDGANQSTAAMAANESFALVSNGTDEWKMAE